MGAGLRRAVNATRATRGLLPIERYEVYHRATMRPFSSTEEGKDLSQADAITLATEIHKERGGRVEVVNSKTRYTTWMRGALLKVDSP
jgi:hypothetical protein